MNLPKQTRYALAGLLILGLSLSVFFWFKKKSASESLNNEAVKDVPAVESTPPKTAGEILLSEFKTFDNEKIKERIEIYNAETREKFNVSEDQTIKPKDFHSFELLDADHYVALNQELVEKSHTDVIDDGVDSIKTDIFSKNPFLKILSVAGPVYFIPQSDKMISIPTEHSCIGKTPTGEGIVYDLKTKNEILKFDFPEGSREVVILENTIPNDFHFNLVQELPLENPQTTCEIGSPVKIVKTFYSITCQSRTPSCQLTTKEIECANGCPEVGACD